MDPRDGSGEEMSLLPSTATVQSLVTHMVKARTDSYKLSSDLQMCAVSHTHTEGVGGGEMGEKKGGRGEGRGIDKYFKI